MNSYITSTYGSRINPVLKTSEFHNGIDIYGEIGDEVLAVADGVVTEVRESETYGRVLVYEINGTKKDVEVFYGHLDEVLVAVGEKVNKGDKVAKCGKTGLVTGAHLHYSIYVDGKTIDPLRYVTLNLTDEAENELQSRRKNEKNNM